MQFLKQSTAVTVKIGPFLDDTDGVTAETALTISQADVRLSKNALNMAQKSETSSCTHDESGYYDCSLNTTDTGTLGRLLLAVSESGALPVWHEYMVVPSNVYEALFGSDRLQVDVREYGDANLALTTQMKADVNAEADTALADYDPPTKAEMDSGFAALNDPTAAAIADAVWDEATSGHTGAGSVCKSLTDILADTGTDGVVISAATAIEIADAILKRDFSSVSGEATRSLINAARALIRWAISGTTLTVYDEVGSPAWTATITSASGNPVTSVTPT